MTSMKNKIRRLLRMQEYCPECDLEIPARAYPTLDTMMLASGRYVRCSLCNSPKLKKEDLNEASSN